MEKILLQMHYVAKINEPIHNTQNTNKNKNKNENKNIDHSANKKRKQCNTRDKIRGERKEKI